MVCFMERHGSQFIEDAFKSRINESRLIQLMYDKFRRYRKQEEEKVEKRINEVRRAGNVDNLERKLRERSAQLGNMDREVSQKQKVRSVHNKSVHNV